MTQIAMPVLIAMSVLIAALVVGVVVWVVYNSLVARRNKVREGLSGVYVQLQRRADLIPNLVETVKGYARHERETLETVTRLRTEFLEISRDDADRLGTNDGLLRERISRLVALAEGYPELKANESFLELQEQLEETEDQIAASRRIYNSNVNDYNTRAESFPANLVARRFAFERAVFFTAEAGAERTPVASLS